MESLTTDVTPTTKQRIARVLEAQERMNARAALSLEQPTVKAALRAFNPLPALETKAS